MFFFLLGRTQMTSSQSHPITEDFDLEASQDERVAVAK